MQRNSWKLFMAATLLGALPLIAHADSGIFSKKSFVESLTNKLGADWNIDSSGGKIVATKKSTVEKKALDSEKVTKECRDIMDDHKKVTVSEQGHTVKITGRSDNCGNLAGDINDVAKVDGVERIEVSVLCDDKSDKNDKK